MKTKQLKTEKCRCVCTLSFLTPTADCEFCNGTGFNTHPAMRYNRWHAICPVCGFVGEGKRQDGKELDDFDCALADDGCVFCNQCNTEIST